MKNTYEEFGVSSDATKGEVKGRWVNLAMDLHPDRGGDAKEFKRMNIIYKRLFALAPECGVCRDAGYVYMQSGFRRTKVDCGCKGKK